MMAFANRNRKELLRDPVNLAFGVGLPVLLLLLITLIQRNMPDMPAGVFAIESFAPGVAMFSFSFISLFCGMLIANDRNTSFLTRLFASPLSAGEFIGGYALPLLPMALVQSVLCFLTAALLGMRLGITVLGALLVLLPVAALFIALGLLLGGLSKSTQVGGIGSGIIQVVAFSSGMWFNLDWVGGVLRGICYALPFAHALDATRDALAGNFSAIWPHLLVVVAWAAALLALAVWIFRRKMKQ